MTQKWFTVGQVVNTHGIRGEVKVVSQTHFPEERFAKGSRLALFGEGPQQEQAVIVESARPQKNVYIIKFQGYNNINDVLPYKGWLLKVSEEHRAELEEDEFYYSDMIGCAVVTEEGEELGEIKEILSPGANDVWVVKRPKGKDLLLPYIDEVVLAVDIAAKRVTVRLMEGLLE
ncbi:ribosome maturation factor RimM [Paenibacillus sp. y28]|uniref:ribosome maturation factor RimM n=1 Tax=Paenibacillus sp. y28 TaxID=3129110 RepID=UPI00301B50B3